MQRLRTSIVAFGMLALASIAWNSMAQDRPDGPPPQDGAGPGGPGGPMERGGPGRPGGMQGQRGPVAGFHLLPAFVADELNLTPEQQKQIAELEKQTKSKLYKILTAKQKRIVEQARPPRFGQAGQGGDRPGQNRARRGQGGPGRGGQGGGPGGPGGGPDGSGGPGGPGGPGGGPNGEGPDRDPPPEQ
jgi:Spy/CpxP family protein refolding chaperone